jgi:hypothetical protein
MRAHTLLMAVLRSVNFLTGVTPGRLFQTAYSGDADHSFRFDGDHYSE